MAVDTASYRSWFNSTRYLVQEKLDEFLANDPIINLFTDETDGSKEDTLNMTGRANDGFAEFTVEGQNASQTVPVEEDQLLKNFVSTKERQVVTWESFLHDKYQFVFDTASELAKKTMNSFYLALTHQLHNFATATSVTLPGAIVYDLKTPDGVALISASHTTPIGGSSITNIGGTGALSEENLTANILVGQENMVTSNGTSMPYNPDMIIVPGVAPLVKKAQQITGSDLVEATGNNAINIYSGGSMKVMVLNFAPLLAGGGRNTTTAKWAWSTADSTMLKKIMHYKWASRPIAQPRFESEENGDSSYLVKSRFAFGASRWQGIVRNNAVTAPTDSGGV